MGHSYEIFMGMDVLTRGHSQAPGTGTVPAGWRIKSIAQGGSREGGKVRFLKDLIFPGLLLALLLIPAFMTSPPGPRAGEDRIPLRLKRLLAEVCQDSQPLLGLKMDFQAVLTLLKSQDYKVRRAAAYVLGQLKDNRATGPLVAMLRDANPLCRTPAARALGRIGDRRALKPLLHLAENEQETIPVRCAALEALGRLGDRTARQPLTRLAENNPGRLGLSAHLALAELDM